MLGALLAAFIFFRAEAPATSGNASTAASNISISHGASADPTIPSPPPSTSTSLPTVEPTHTARRAWDQAFAQARQTNIRVAAHQAAISGSLIDAMAVERARQRCLILNAQFRSALSLHKEKVPDSMQQAAARLEQVCEGAITVGPPKLLSIRDDAGFGDLAEALLNRNGMLRDSALRERLLQRILETQSLELLEAFSPSLLRQDTMPLLGLEPSADLLAAPDEAMLRLAVQLRACNARGDCDRVAQENFTCIESQSCLSDLNDFPDQLIFVPPAQRSFVYRLTEKPIDEAVLRRRWAEIQAAVARIGG
ncbi:hypothetical protein [Roseateles noduli]|uniref:hypothetical protein n=1 Tax=Roseateles noduli TaxID=2052484 RepID=UPI003D6552EE